MPRLLRKTILATCLLWAGAGTAAGLADYSGEWIEQADDPLKVRLQPLEEGRLEALTTHGRSDQIHRQVLQLGDNRLLDASGKPVYALENGKLRQLDAGRLVLFVRLQ